MSSEPQKICHSCQAELPLNEKVCPFCHQKQLSALEVLIERFIRAIMPRYIPATRVLFISIIVYFIIISIDIVLHTDFGLKGALLAPPGEIIYRWGAHQRGDFVWWRLVTANFVHFGIMHIAFNAYALRMISPYIERSYGSAAYAEGFGFKKCPCPHYGRHVRGRGD